MASGDILPILKVALLKLTLGWHSLITWMFFPNITDESILGLDIKHTNNSFGDLRRHVL
jgi:hypothetical protein